MMILSGLACINSDEALTDNRLAETTYIIPVYGNLSSEDCVIK